MVTNTYINEQMKGYKLDNTKFFWRVSDNVKLIPRNSVQSKTE